MTLGEIDEIEGGGEPVFQLLAELSESAWALSGRSLPDYARSETPIRLVRLDSLHRNKAATGREKDRLDLELLSRSAE